MPARAEVAAAIVRSTAADGLMMAPIRTGGRWEALRALHEGMARLRGAGIRPDLSFVIALAEDGRIVQGRDPEASVFLLGYRLA